MTRALVMTEALAEFARQAVELDHELGPDLAAVHAAWCDADRREEFAALSEISLAYTSSTREGLDQ